MRLLAVLLLTHAAVAAAASPIGHPEARVDAAAADLRAVYEASKARCKHGHAGVLLMLHPEADPNAYRSELQARAAPDHALVDDYAHVHALQRAVSMRAIHPATMQRVIDHRHTRRIDANCIIRREMPLADAGASSNATRPPKRRRLEYFGPRNVSEAARELFTGRYRDARSCEHHISVPYGLSASGSSGSAAALLGLAPHAVISLQSPSLDDLPGATCANATIPVMVTRLSGSIEMAGRLLGSLSIHLPGGGLVVGLYTADPEARLEDRIEWQATRKAASLTDFGTWVKLTGRPYDKNSSIGPLDDGKRGVRTRNPSAYMRWNWGLARLDKPKPTLDDTYTYGAATGNGTTVYLLDTGVAISHDEFGGRATPGISVRCRTGEEKDCLSKWAYKGVIDDEVLARDPIMREGCDIHGTHTASTAAGKRYARARLLAQRLPRMHAPCSMSMFHGHAHAHVTMSPCHHAM